MIHGLEEAPGAKLGVGQHTPCVEHGTGGDTPSLQVFHHLILPLFTGPRSDDCVQFLLMAKPGLGGGKPGVSSEGRLAQGLAKGHPVGVIPDRDCDPFVVAPAGIAAVGRHGAVAIADAIGPSAVERVVQHPGAHEGHPNLVHGQVDPHAPAGTGPM